MATLMGASIVVVLGATVFAIAPAAPRDRPVPSLTIADDRPLRITILGTSLSAPSRYTWPDDVASRVSGQIGRPVEVRRVTQPGASSTWGVSQVGSVLVAQPDVVLIEFAVNDADARHHMTVQGSVARHEQMLAGLQAGGHPPVIVLLTMNPASGPRAWARPFLSRYYAEYVGLAERHDTGLVDLYPRWLALPDDRRDLLDGLHPSDAAASREIVGPVTDALVRAVGPQPG